MIEKFQSLEVRGRKSSKPWKFFAVLFPMLGSLAFAQGPGSISQGGFFSAWWGKQTVFDPSQIAGLVAWYDADDSATVSVQAGTNTVTGWNDKTTNALNLAAFGGNNARYITNSFNGLPSIRFLSAGGVLRFASSSVFSNIPYASIFAVGRHTGGDSIRIFVGGTIGNNARVYLYASNTNDVRAGGRRLNGDAFQSETGGTFATNTVAILSGFYNFADAELIVGLNNNYTTRAGGFQTAGNTTTDPVNFGLGNNPGAAASNLLVGDIFEVLVYHAKLTTTERAIITDYLNRKWGVY
jgi:hypothetical protein